jgi:hypothetical protein
MHPLNDNNPYPLLDGPLAGPLKQFCNRKIMVERMAADLIEAKSFGSKRTAMATLMSLRGADGLLKYKPFLVFSLGSDAMHEAEQQVIAAVMSDPVPLSDCQRPEGDR